MSLKEENDDFSRIVNIFLIEYCEDLDKISKNNKSKIQEDMILVYAPTQSGKTKFCIGLAIRSIINGYIPIIILRNLKADMEQLVRNLNNILKNLSIFLKKHKYNNKNIIFDNKIIVSGNYIEYPKGQQKIIDGLKKKQPCIIITLANEAKLNTIIELVSRTPYHFDLNIDEIDNVDYGKGETKNCLSELKNKSHQTFAITATPLDCIFAENTLKTNSQLSLTIPNGYRGFNDIVVKHLEYDVKSVNRVVTFQEQIEIDCNIIPFLDKYVNQKAGIGLDGLEYPNIVLFKINMMDDSQEMFVNGINKLYSDLATICYNGNGTLIYYKDMQNDKYIGKIIKKHVFSKLTISEALQYLYDKGNVKKFPNILINSGYLASRGISFVPLNYKWHLTDMYYTPAISTTIPEMIQSSGRLTGINAGKSHLCLYMTEKTANQLRHGLKFTYEIITRAIENVQNHEKSLSDSILSVPIKKDKLPKYRCLTTKVKVKKRNFNLVKKGNDGGWDISEYGYCNDNNDNIMFDILHVKEDILPTSTKIVYDNTISVIIELVGTGKWIRRGDIIKDILKYTTMSRPMIEARLKDIGQNNRFHNKVIDENISGLVLCKKDNEWYLRVN